MSINIPIFYYKSFFLNQFINDGKYYNYFSLTNYIVSSFQNNDNCFYYKFALFNAHAMFKNHGFEYEKKKKIIDENLVKISI